MNSTGPNLDHDSTAFAYSEGDGDGDGEMTSNAETDDPVTTPYRFCIHDGCWKPIVLGVTTLFGPGPWFCLEHAESLCTDYVSRFIAHLREVEETMTEDTPRTTSRETEERFRRVAAAYRSGGVPRVMTDIGVARSQAYRLVSLARKAGIITE